MLLLDGSKKLTGHELERQKVCRKIKQVKKELGERSLSPARLTELQESLFSLRVDLNYILVRVTHGLRGFRANQGVSIIQKLESTSRCSHLQRHLVLARLMLKERSYVVKQKLLWKEESWTPNRN